MCTWSPHVLSSNSFSFCFLLIFIPPEASWLLPQPLDNRCKRCFLPPCAHQAGRRRLQRRRAAPAQPPTAENSILIPPCYAFSFWSVVISIMLQILPMVKSIFSWRLAVGQTWCACNYIQRKLNVVQELPLQHLFSHEMYKLMDLIPRNLVKWRCLFSFFYASGQPARQWFC